MLPELSERTKGFTESVIRRMTRICNQHDAVNLSQGFPDFDPPQPLLDALAQAAVEGPHQYALTWGVANSRQALTTKQSKLLGRSIAPEAIIDVAKKAHDFLTVGAVPGSCFCREEVRRFIRFHFAKKDETLESALNRLGDLRAKFKNYRSLF